jgi:hypothetical protein
MRQALIPNGSIARATASCSLVRGRSRSSSSRGTMLIARPRVLLAYEKDSNAANVAAREMLLEMVRAIDNGEVGEGEGTANILVPLPGFGKR